MKGRKQYWLVSTEHLENRLWVRSDEDFKVGMNYVAVQAGTADISVLAFILMSNHVHFVLEGSMDDALVFINGFKKRYAQYVQNTYGHKELLRRNAVDIRGLPTENEAVERAIAYVHMNCVAANICAHPSQYEWGSGNVLFNRSREAGIPVSSFSHRKLASIMHCTLNIPGDWVLGTEGFILPSSYLSIETSEAIFRTPKRMNYFLFSSSKARKIRETEDNLPSFRDQNVAASIPDICRTMFGSNSLKELSSTQVAEVLRQIRYRFSSNINQIARVTGLSYQQAAALLDQM